MLGCTNKCTSSNQLRGTNHQEWNTRCCTHPYTTAWTVSQQEIKFVPRVGVGAVFAVGEARHESHQRILCPYVQVVVHLPIHLPHLTGRMEQPLKQAIQQTHLTWSQLRLLSRLGTSNAGSCCKLMTAALSRRYSQSQILRPVVAACPQTGLTAADNAQLLLGHPSRSAVHKYTHNKPF